MNLSEISGSEAQMSGAGETAMALEMCILRNNNLFIQLQPSWGYSAAFGNKLKSQFELPAPTPRCVGIRASVWVGIGAHHRGQ